VLLPNLFFILFLETHDYKLYLQPLYLLLKKLAMKISFKILTIFIVLLPLLFLSCDDGDNGSISIGENIMEGKWYFHKSQQTFTYNDGDVDIFEYVYKDYFDYDLYAGTIFEFTENEMNAYANDYGEYWYENNYDFILRGNKLILTQGLMDEPDTLLYGIVDDMLILKELDANNYVTEEYIRYFKRYNGDIPPSSWTHNIQSDTYEHDNNMENATPIAVNSEPQMHTLTSYDQDFFKFDAVAGKTYLIRGNGYLDNVVYLYDAEGQAIDYDDDSYENDFYEVATSYNPLLFFECNISGTYYFEFRAYDYYDQGYYYVDVQEVDAMNFKSRTETDNKKKPFFKSNNIFENIKYLK
jgi:hypothetical protein